VPAARYDAVVVGSGPNGLAAAVELARAGRSVLVLEGAEAVGGGTRTEELTLPGFRHDVCSAVHPLLLASPFFRSLELAEHGLEPIQPPAPLAHPFRDGSAAVLERSLDATGTTLGVDAEAWRRAFAPLVGAWEALVDDALAPVHVPRHPLTLARVGALALRPATAVAASLFAGEGARALFAGCAAHAVLPLTRAPSAAFGLALATLGHAVGWPVVRGGSASIADALVSHLRSLGGEVETGRPVSSLADVPPARAVLLDLTPRGVLRVAGDRLPARYRRALARFRYGPGVFKLDYALDGPIPWRAPECLRAATVHVGGTLAELAVAEDAVARGRVPERPFLLVAQQSLFDPTRAPEAKHTAWVYCHVPNGCTLDVTDAVEAQLERFAPGFRDRVLARSVLSPAALERHDPNLVGGDVTGGVQDLRQLLFRPAFRLDPYATPVPGLYLCSASTPPGGGVHGLCGSFAARSALARTLA
jgi:phytoene dehydrogenase-like protein